MQIAVIGLGQMGSRMAARLLAQGHTLVAYNRSVQRLDPLVALGAVAAPSVESAVAAADLVITSLRGADAEEQLASAFIPAMQPGAVHVSTSTLSPSLSRSLALAHAQRGTAFLSAPVQGRPEAVESGQLLVWASGARSAFDAARPVLDAIASNVHWLGESPEQAPAAKLALNMLMFANIELLAEAHHYLSRCGVDPAQFGSVITQTAFATPLFKAITAGLLSTHASQGTTLRGSWTDLQMLLTHAGERGATLPAASVVEQRYAAAIRDGHGDLAQTAVLLSLVQDDSQA